MATTIKGKPLNDCSRAELVGYCTRQLKHTFRHCQYLSTGQLREYVQNDHVWNEEKTVKTDTPPPTTEPVNPPVKPAGSSTGALLDAITNDVASAVEERILHSLRAQFDEALESRPRETVLTIHNGNNLSTVNLGLIHEATPKIIKITSSGCPVYLYGPAGSGKSTMAIKVAEALSTLHNTPIDCYSQSFGPASQLHELIGIPAINGHPAQVTPLWQAWERPSVILLDELDAAPDLFIQLNSGIANGFIVFADGQKHTKHPLCHIIAAGNTTMSGATMTYTSRARQDKATVDRFAFVPVDYDETLELAAAGTHAVKWTKHVQKVRKALQTLGASAPDLLVSPRASINGGKVLATDPTTTFDELEELFIWRGASDDEKSKVRYAMMTL